MHLPIKRAYDGFNASDSLHLEFFDGGHRWRKEILPWFTGKLRESLRSGQRSKSATDHDR